MVILVDFALGMHQVIEQAAGPPSLLLAKVLAIDVLKSNRSFANSA